MKKRIFSTLLCFALMVALPGNIIAVGAPRVAVAAPVTEEVPEEALPEAVPAEMSVEPRFYAGSTYVAYMDVVRLLYPDAVAVWEDGQVIVTDEGLELIIRPGAYYLICNGRYLYVPHQVQNWNYQLFVPIRVLCKGLGAAVCWDSATSTAIVVPGAGPITSGEEFYEERTLYWLSHIINAESGNQSLEGKIAVGNVVMNRVKDPAFPSDIKDVIYQRNQFTPAMTGSVKKAPNAESIVAAKLVLDGANTAGNSLFFVNPKYAPNCWAARNREYVTTIGAHDFFA